MTLSHPPRRLLCIDVGGTFTDALAFTPDGHVRTAKVLSTGTLRARLTERLDGPRCRIDLGLPLPDGFLTGFSARSLDGRCTATIRHHVGEIIELESSLSPGLIELVTGEEAPILAARILTATPPGLSLPAIDMRLATTRGTNALLQRNGAPVALFVTQGFGDLLRIGNQSRPDLFALRIIKPEPLHAEVVEVDERLDASGSVLRPLDLNALKKDARRVVESGITHAAVALLHSWINPAHERAVGEVLCKAGFTHVSLSSRLSPYQRILPRAETAVVNAMLSAVIEPYLARINAALSGGRLFVMTSAGALVEWNDYRPCESLLSGPAGGVVGAGATGAKAGALPIIAVDMGGTSTDVSRCDGRLAIVGEHTVGDARIASDALAIETVAAGGGSVCWFDGFALRVGPHSAGASPGPACYGASGPLTITDVNLLLGRLEPANFEIPLDTDAAHAALNALLEEVENVTARRMTDDEVLHGLLEIANERMAAAMRRVSVQRGFDPREHTLLAFGGASAQHACALADRLSMTTVIVPPHAGILSAVGLSRAVVARTAGRQINEAFDSLGREGLQQIIDDLAATAEAALRPAGHTAASEAAREVLLSLRLHEQESTIHVPMQAGSDPKQDFAERFAALYGYELSPDEVIEVESVRVTIAAPSGELRLHNADAIMDSHTIAGPALLSDDYTTIVVEPGWTAQRQADGSLRLHRVEPVRTPAVISDDAVELELFTSRFRAIVEQMGEMLRRISLSTNVKERLDFSCGLLDADGRLVANAPHIPVHLGALGACVRAVAAALPPGPGDVAITNHPAFGGSHLPDITLITPVFDDGSLLGYVASRAHHAEIGGIHPGSMPAGATRLAEEGVIIAPQHLVRGGCPCWREIEALLTSGTHPTRNLRDNLADLRGALAANQRGADALSALSRAHGQPNVLRFMGLLQQRAETQARRAIATIPDGVYEADEHLDDGTPLRVAITIRGDEADFDFTGSGGVHPGSFNATPAIVQSVVVYVMRLLIDEPLPLNDGLLNPVRILIPRLSLLDPAFETLDEADAPAVAAGNVETSQRLTDLLLKALGLAACSQGTMNNCIFGNARFGYYETICGGSGATPDGPGADAVQTHMTNTRITDPEVLESRYPVRLEGFAIRRDSGGAGEHDGGNGVVREFLFLDDVDLSLITQHRVEAPFGLQGGHPGAPGRQTVIRADGSAESLPSSVQTTLRAGERLIIETPGGGGFGQKK